MNFLHLTGMPNATALMAKSCRLALISLVTLLTAHAGAQISAPPSSPQPQPPPSRAAAGRVLRRMLADEKAVWTAPLRANRRDLEWIAPLLAGTAASIAFDRWASDAVRNNTALIDTSQDYSNAVTIAFVTAAGGMYLAGKGAHRDSLTETGLLSMEALAPTALVTEATKVAFNRAYPASHDESEFWDAGKSFISGHTSFTWAVATVIAKRYPDHPKLRLLMYGLATSVAATRVSGRKHFPSDVIAGAATGYLIGAFVVRQHEQNRSSKIHFFPAYDPASRGYAARLVITP